MDFGGTSNKPINYKFKQICYQNKKNWGLDCKTQGGETHKVHPLLEINKLIRYLHDLENILENARNTNK